MSRIGIEGRVVGSSHPVDRAAGRFGGSIVESTAISDELRSHADESLSAGKRHGGALDGRADAASMISRPATESEESTGGALWRKAAAIPA
jgi:hypothetical protein